MSDADPARHGRGVGADAKHMGFCQVRTPVLSQALLARSGTRPPVPPFAGSLRLSHAAHRRHGRCRSSSSRSSSGCTISSSSTNSRLQPNPLLPPPPPETLQWQSHRSPGTTLRRPSGEGYNPPSAWRSKSSRRGPHRRLIPPEPPGAAVKSDRDAKLFQSDCSTRDVLVATSLVQTAPRVPCARSSSLCRHPHFLVTTRRRWHPHPLFIQLQLRVTS